MKVLLVSNMYPSKRWPTYGVFVKNFECGLLENGFHIDRIVLNKENNKFLKILKYIIFYLRIFTICIIGNYDVVYVHYVSHCAIPILLSRRWKKFKLYINVHGSDVIPVKRSQYKFQKYVEKIMNICDKIIVPSNYYKNVVERKFNVDSSKVFIYPSGGVDSKKFSYNKDKLQLRVKMGISQDKFLFGYVGRIDLMKGWDVFLKAIKYLKDNDLMNDKLAIIVGNGTQVNKFRSMINEYGLKEYIVYYDLLPQDKLSDIFNLLDVFSFPTNGESLGLVGLESMMCGTPVIGSDVEALREYILPGITGELHKKGDFLVLGDIINKFSKYSNDVINQYRDNCIKVALNYESTSVTNSIVRFLKS